VSWIFGIIFVIIIIGGINAVTNDTPDEEDIKQIGETGLTETQVQAEEIASDQGSELTENNSENSNSENSNSENSNSADSSIEGDRPVGYNSEDSNPDNKETSVDGNLTVNFLDVGQGDSILLEYDGKAMLIDAGEQKEGAKVSAYLYEHDISSISYVVATHPHSDHIGGMDQVLNDFKVEHFVDSGFPYTSKTYENMLTTIDKKNIPFEVAKKGDEIEFDPAVDIEVLNPDVEYTDELNENSVVLKVSYGKISFLLMGDAGLETEEALMDEGYDLDSDILKAGHHASQSGSGEEFISLVSPEISIIEVGAGNDYGHPHKEVLERLQKASRVYRTDLDGTISVSTDGLTYTVTTEKKGSEEKTRTIPGGAYSSTDSGITEESEFEESTTSTMNTMESAESDVYVSDLNLEEEWVKITNKESSPVSLKGWKIEDKGSKHTYTFHTCTLDSQATVILYTGTGKDKGTEIYWGSGSPVWNNDGDTAYLYNDSGKLVASLER
jgi:beta-lactamase superfamily II metal-dependent hydrolase